MGYMSIWNMESVCHVYESMKDNITHIDILDKPGCVLPE